MISIFSVFNLQLLRAVGRGEAQGKDREDYMKREGMIWGIKQEAHCNITSVFFLVVFFFTIASWLKDYRRRRASLANVDSSPSAHQVVQLWILAEEGLVLSLLLVHKVLNIHVEAGRRYAFGSLRGLFTFLKQQSEQRKQRMPEETKREKKGN